MTFATVKQYATRLLLEVNYVDAYRRNVGLDYREILGRLKTEFPNSNTTVKELQKIAYGMNGQNIRLPVRRSSRRILARDFARSLLIHRDEQGIGLSYQAIGRRVRSLFPELPTLSICQVRNTAGHLSRAGIALPTRPGKKS